MLSRFSLASNILAFVLSILWNISKSSFNAKELLSLGQLYFFITTTFPIYVNKFVFTKFFWLHIYSLSNGPMSTSPWSAISSIAPFMFLRLAITCHLFIVLSSLLANLLWWLPICVKCHVGLSLRDKEATWVHTLLSVCRLNSRYSNQSPTILKRSDMIHSRHLTVIISWRASRKFALYALIQLIWHGN